MTGKRAEVRVIPGARGGGENEFGFLSGLDQWRGVEHFGGGGDVFPG
jgi:hypothetical protein